MAESVVFVLPWLIDHPGPGGVCRVVRCLYEECQRSEDYRPLLCATDWSHRRPTWRSGEPRTVMCRLRRPPQSWADLRTALAFLVRGPFEFGALARLLSDENVSVVNVHYPSLNALDVDLLRVLQRYRGRLVLSFHGTDLTAAAAARGQARWLWRRLLMRADAVTVCSWGLGRALRTTFPDCPIALHIIQNGLDLELFRREQTAALGEVGPDLPHRYVLNIGKFEHGKGQDVLLRAFAQFAPRFPDLGLVLVGNKGTNSEETAARVARSGLAHRIRRIENLPHSRIGALIEGASVFALPSRREGLPIVLLEAGAYARPVVASAVGGIPEVVQDGVNGRLVPPEDAEALAAAIADLLENEEAARRLGEALHDTVRTRFSWRRTYDGYLGAFRGLPAANGFCGTNEMQERPARSR